MNRLSPFRRKDPRDSIDKEFETHCTFRPIINGESPFISERTIRTLEVSKLAKRLRQPPPPPSNKSLGTHLLRKFRRKRNAKTHESLEVIGGLYKSTTGLVRGPPTEIGIPIFYFDPLNPPNFDLGYVNSLTRSIKEESYIESDIGAPQKDHDQAVQSSTITPSIAAPPLPPWVNQSVRIYE